MRIVVRALIVVAGVILVALAAIMIYARTTGLSAKPAPPLMEGRAARMARSFAIPADVRRRTNPVPLSDEVLAEGMAHYADHCASCHADDGSGNTEMGRGLYPKAPDMRLPATQQLTDGELFYIIENGVRFTGMPGWSTGTAEGETATWHLVHVVRHLPAMTGDQVEKIQAMQPRSPEEIRREIEEDEFLKGAHE
jgi:mono/diheme cytochrome c family protein